MAVEKGIANARYYGSSEIYNVSKNFDETNSKDNDKDRAPEKTDPEKNLMSNAEKYIDTENSCSWESLKNEFRINKELLPLKLATFCFHGGKFSIF